MWWTIPIIGAVGGAAAYLAHRAQAASATTAAQRAVDERMLRRLVLVPRGLLRYDLTRVPKRVWGAWLSEGPGVDLLAKYTGRQPPLYRRPGRDPGPLSDNIIKPDTWDQKKQLAYRLANDRLTMNNVPVPLYRWGERAADSFQAIPDNRGWFSTDTAGLLDTTDPYVWVSHDVALSEDENLLCWPPLMFEGEAHADAWWYATQCWIRRPNHEWTWRLLRRDVLGSKLQKYPDRTTAYYWLPPNVRLQYILRYSPNIIGHCLANEDGKWAGQPRGFLPTAKKTQQSLLHHYTVCCYLLASEGWLAMPENLKVGIADTGHAEPKLKEFISNIATRDKPPTRQELQTSSPWGPALAQVASVAGSTLAGGFAAGMAAFSSIAGSLIQKAFIDVDKAIKSCPMPWHPDWTPVPVDSAMLGRSPAKIDDVPGLREDFGRYSASSPPGWRSGLKKAWPGAGFYDPDAHQNEKPSKVPMVGTAHTHMETLKERGGDPTAWRGGGQSVGGSLTGDGDTKRSAAPAASDEDGGIIKVDLIDDVEFDL